MANKIADNIRKLRKLYGESQAQLADYLGVSKKAISNYENSIRQLSLDALEKLSEHYAKSIDDLLNSSIPNFIFKGFDVDFYCKLLNIIFPIYEHKQKTGNEDNESFVAAVTAHRKLLEAFSMLYDNDNDAEVFKEDFDLELCKENYLRAIQNDEYTIYCKANLVGLIFIWAHFIYSMMYVKDIPESALIAVSGDQNIKQGLHEGWEIYRPMLETAMSSMRSKGCMEMLDKYLDALSNNKVFEDLAEYYRCWRYMLNMVDNDDGRIVNFKYGIHRMIEYAEKDNMYASMYLLIFSNAIEITA